MDSKAETPNRVLQMKAEMPERVYHTQSKRHHLECYTMSQTPGGVLHMKSEM